MTSTQIKINNPSSKMSQLTGMNSFSFKVVSILFIIILNITGLSSQNSAPVTRNYSGFIKPTVSYSKKATVVPRPTSQKVHNLHIVRNFPILEGVSKQELTAMEVHELFDYDLIFGNVFSKTKGPSKINSITSLTTSKI